MGYGITGWTPGGGRQSLTYSLKPGQKRGMGTGRIYQNNVVINNFGAMPRGVDMYYSHNCCNNNSGLSTFEKWMLGLGTGFGALRAVLGAIFGGGSNEGAGGVEEKPNDNKYQTLLDKIDEQQKAIDKLQKQLAKPATTPAAPAKPEPEPEPAEEATPQITKAKDGVLGSKADISGTVTVGENGEVSIKDVQNTYTYQKTGRTVNYNGTEYPVYQLTGATSNATGKALPTTNQEYILMNGELVQPSDCTELQGLGTGSIQKSKPTAATPKKDNENKVELGRTTGVPFQELNGIDKISDPVTKTYALSVQTEISKLPAAEQNAYTNSLNSIIDELNSNKSPAAKHIAQQKLTTLLNTIKAKTTEENKNDTNKSVQEWNKKHPENPITSYPNGELRMSLTKPLNSGMPGASKATTISANSFAQLMQKRNEWLNS